MTSKVIYQGNLRTELTHLRSGSVIENDAPVDNHGKGERFSPTDLVATALASCMLTTMGIISANHKINIDGSTCEVEKIMVSNPRRIGIIRIQMQVLGQASYTEKEKQILEKTALTCPVYESLHPDVKKELEIHWPS